jgi:hypothetical protein
VRKSLDNWAMYLKASRIHQKYFNGYLPRSRGIHNTMMMVLGLGGEDTERLVATMKINGT